MRDEKQLAGGLVLVCILVALLGGALWLGLSGKRLLGSKLADLLDPVEEQRFSLIAQHRSAGKAVVWDKPALVGVRVHAMRHALLRDARHRESDDCRSWIESRRGQLRLHLR